MPTYINTSETAPEIGAVVMLEVETNGTVYDTQGYRLDTGYWIATNGPDIQLATAPTRWRECEPDEL